MMLGYKNLAILKSVLISFSDSPNHLETKEDDDILKNVD
jgi:hypothetical protein